MKLEVGKKYVSKAYNELYTRIVAYTPGLEYPYIGVVFYKNNKKHISAMFTSEGKYDGHADYDLIAEYVEPKKEKEVTLFRHTQILNGEYIQQTSWNNGTWDAKPNWKLLKTETKTEVYEIE